MSGQDPAFLALLLAMVVLGAVLPVPIDDREDHIVLALVAPVAIGVLGVGGIAMVWVGVLAALPVIAARNLGRAEGGGWDAAGARRQLGWTAMSALCVTAGGIVGVAVYQVGFGRSFPIVLDSVGDMVVGGVVLLASWVATMATRILTIRRERPLLADSLDPVDSVWIPYLLPALAGFPFVTACMALYQPDDPWRTVLVLWWALPVYAAIALDVHRRRVAQDLRREALANQRLAAIGEVSARIVHQSRHQVGLMGWSVHRLRGLVGSADPVDVAAADAELDALTEAKDRLGALLTSEVLHESVTERAAPLVPAAEGLAAVVLDVCDQLRPEADREGVALAVSVEGPEAPAAPKVRDVVFNLVDNAIDAAVAQVVVRVATGPDGTTLEVADDGPGIDGGDLSRAIEPFFTTKGDGTGMGLAIADAVVGDLGGDLRYERLDGRTRFVVVLPAPVGEPAPRPARP